MQSAKNIYITLTSNNIMKHFVIFPVTEILPLFYHECKANYISDKATPMKAKPYKQIVEQYEF